MVQKITCNVQLQQSEAQLSCTKLAGVSTHGTTPRLNEAWPTETHYNGT